MKTIYLVRHGLSQANVDGLLAGASTQTPLTLVGEQQARDAVGLFKGKQVDVIVSSPLERALKTATIIAEGIGYKGQIVIEPLFIEREFGSATSKPSAEGFAMLDNHTVVGAESVADFARRAGKALAWLKARSEGHILVVSHAGFSQMLGTVASKLDPSTFLDFKRLGYGTTYEFKV